MGIEDLDRDELLAELARQLIEEAEVPEGYYTNAEIYEQIKKIDPDTTITDDGLRMRLRKLVRIGRLQKMVIRHKSYYRKADR